MIANKKVDFFLVLEQKKYFNNTMIMTVLNYNKIKPQR